MNDLTFDIVDDSAEFFAPVSSDAIDGLIGQYQSFRARILQVAEFVHSPEVASAVHYFLDGNRSEERGRTSLDLSVKQLFQVEGAIGALNAAFWSKTLALTDVLDIMPQKRRNEWHEQIRNPLGVKDHRKDGAWTVEPLPAFEDATVRATITQLLHMRSQFLAERVDGIFRGLSGEHVTNAPEAFGKRMIIARVLNAYGNSEHTTCGLINDLRCVIAKFMGRDEPGYRQSSALIDGMKGHWGEWVTIDGGALKVRLYKKGTAHLEVHPDMAWRLNMVLAALYPLAIPAEFRQRPKRRIKAVDLLLRPLPFRVLDVLADVKMARRRVSEWPERYADVPNTIAISYTDRGKAVLSEVRAVLESLGGVQHPDNSSWFQFDYRPMDVIKQVVLSGCVPDTVSHQFYPTPETLGTKAVALAEILPGQSVLEPSAGNGGLADLVQAAGGNVTCVEVSALRCAVLLAKGHSVVQGDFLATPLPDYDRVVMNPPFDSGRWLAHVEHAAGMVKPGGVLVAVLPSGAKSRALNLPGFELDWHGPFDNQFAGASVSVVLLKARRAA